MKHWVERCGDRKVLHWKSDSTDVCDLGESCNSFEAQFSPLSSRWEFICPDAPLRGGNEIMYLRCDYQSSPFPKRFRFLCEVNFYTDLIELMYSWSALNRTSLNCPT